MADLIVLLPAHGYSNTDPLYVSWLNGIYYVADKDANSFKLTTTSGGATYVQYVEEQTSGYVRYDNGIGTTTIKGLDHLEGETVSVVANGSFIGSYTVSGGAITVSTSVTSYRVGLPYTMKLKLMRFSVPEQSNNTMQSRVKRIHEVIIRGVYAKGGSAGQQVGSTESTQDLDFEYSTESSDIKTLIDGGMDKDGYIILKSTEPYPFTVLAIIANCNIEENR